jgi:hypothetical protein
MSSSSTNKQNWSKLTGHRVLVSPTDESSKGPFEYTVKEVSPSGNKVKMENRAGRTFWCASNEYVVEEDLG